MKFHHPFTRREFLKASSLSLVGMFLLPFKETKAQTINEYHGRVIDYKISIHQKPSFKSEVVQDYWHDAVIPITRVTIGDEEPAYNRVWYQLDNSGYAHSGRIQPVKIKINPAVSQIPPEGILAETTVPFTDAHWNPSKKSAVAYRFYYQTTHWVTGLVYDDEGNPWYQVFEDRWEFRLFAPAEHFRLIPDSELAPISPDVPQDKKRLEVNTGEQHVTAIEFDRPVFRARIASGAKFSNGNFSTPGGTHLIFHKRPFRHMAAGNLAANGFDLPGVPWVSYFTERGVAFHGTYWHNDYGRPRSHGCVNLSPDAAKWIYRWTNPVVPADKQRVVRGDGTEVNVR